MSKTHTEPRRPVSGDTSPRGSFCSGAGRAFPSLFPVTGELSIPDQSPPQTLKKGGKKAPAASGKTGGCRGFGCVLGFQVGREDSAVGLVFLAVALQLLLVAIDEVTVGNFCPNGLVGAVVVDRRVIHQQLFLLLQAGIRDRHSRQQGFGVGVQGGDGRVLPSQPAPRYGPC